MNKDFIVTYLDHNNEQKAVSIVAHDKTEAETIIANRDDCARVIGSTEKNP